MFSNSDIVLPSVYLYEKTLKPQERRRLDIYLDVLTFRNSNHKLCVFSSMVIGRIKEAVRVSKSYSEKPKPIYVYIRYVYADSKKLLTEVNICWKAFNYIQS